MVMPALLQALHDVVPSYTNSFMWVDERGGTRRTLVENPDEVEPVLPLYFNGRAARYETEVRFTCSEMMGGRQGVYSQEQVLKVDHRAYRRHAFYNEIMRPTGNHQSLCFVVRKDDGPLGMGMVSRTLGERGFKTSEKRELQALLPYIAHALEVPDDRSVPLSGADDEGFLLVDRRAVIRYMSPVARRLVCLARDPVFSDNVFYFPGGERMLRKGLAGLVRKLLDASHDSCHNGAPPVWRHRNAWGGYVFRAQWLEGGGDRETHCAAGLSELVSSEDPDRLIGVTVRYQEPLSLKLLRRLQRFSLSPRQREVGLWLAQGASLREISARLHISERTVGAHARALYDKLGVHNRAQLVNKLSAA